MNKKNKLKKKKEDLRRYIWNYIFTCLVAIINNCMVLVPMCFFFRKRTRALGMLGMYSTTDLHPQPARVLDSFLFYYKNN
jgi:hypothetical protein